ncbi:hypothetical protein M0804_009138 [Polistes exclamans]|nr:hypothetical protein M0804_009138 [Polistes exclamans]
MVKKGSKSVSDGVSNSGSVLGPTPSQYLRVAVGHFTTLIGSVFGQNYEQTNIQNKFDTPSNNTLYVIPVLKRLDS